MPQLSPLTKETFLWLLFLGALFFGSYGFANWYSATLPEVPSSYFEWEKDIPVIPWLIIPYMSIDFFFAASLFLCKERDELRTHVKRIVFCIVLSIGCFLVFPLQFAFARPQVDGFFGDIFAILYGFDKPFNQAPSLHISLLMCLWAVYATHTTRWLNALVHLWFALIAASVLFTYQHHFIDVPTGVLVGVMAFYFFPDKKDYGGYPVRFHTKLVVIYGCLAAIMAGLVFIQPPYSLIMLWPACAFALVAAAYSGLGSNVFRKDSGKHYWASRLLLAPYRLGAFISYVTYTVQDDAYRPVGEHIIVGRKLNLREAQELCNHNNVVAVLDIAPEFSATRPFHNISYCSISVLDLTPPTIEQLQQAVSFIEQHASSGRVYIHCALGYSRSVAVAIAYLLYTRRYSNLEEAIVYIRSIHPKIVLNEHYQQVLQRYAGLLCG